MLLAVRVHMPIDLCYVIALSSRMRVIHYCLSPEFTLLSCFLLHHTSANAGSMYHTGDRGVHAHTVPLDYYRATDDPHKGQEQTYGDDHARHVHSITYGPVWTSTSVQIVSVIPCVRDCALWLSF